MSGRAAMPRERAACAAAFAAAVAAAEPVDLPAMERIAISADGRRFVLQPSGREFLAWGFNYDHDRDGRLIEDYWDAEWATVEADFREMKALGANVARVHLQVGRFLAAPDRVQDGAISARW